MKRKFSILTVSLVVAGLALSLVGTALVSQAAPVDKNQNSYKQAPKPVSATNIKVVKKVFLSPDDIRGIKGKPASPPGLDKNKDQGEGTATGVVGEGAMGEKYAVVIGICDYPGTANDLCVSDGDSLHMYKALTTLYGYDPANIRLFKDTGDTTYFEENLEDEIPSITAEVPTYENILDAIDTIRAAVNPGDEVVFFFSGHGANGNADDGDAEDIDEAIVVYSNDSSDIDFIWDGELRDLFDGFATTRIAFIFDTCLAGGQNDVASEGRVVSMATGETKSAYVYSRAGEDVDGDGIDDGEGVFSRYFVNMGMLQGLADAYNQLKATDGNVAIEEAFDYAKENIPRPFRGRQKPVISDQFTDDLLL